MTATLTYVGLYVILSILIALLLFCAVTAIVLLLSTALKLISGRTAGSVLAVSTVLCPLVVAPLPYYTLAHNFNYYPPYPELSYLEQQANNTDKELRSLRDRADEIKSRLNSLNSQTVNEINLSLEKSMNLLEDIKFEVEKKRLLISALSQAAVDEREEAAKAREQVEQLKTISQEQGNAMAGVFVKAMEEESRKSFLLGILISFPIGIGSSLLASLIYRKLGGRTRAILKSGIDN